MKIDSGVQTGRAMWSFTESCVLIVELSLTFLTGSKTWEDVLLSVYGVHSLPFASGSNVAL